MSKSLAKESLYLEHQLDVNAQRTSVRKKPSFYLAKIVLVLVFIASMSLFSFFQVRLYSRIITYRREINALEESIRDLTIRNERLRKEFEDLSSPTRLRKEAERLGLQPSDRLLELPIN